MSVRVYDIRVWLHVNYRLRRTAVVLKYQKTTTALLILERPVVLNYMQE